MRITISGPPGSGKTTTCTKLSKALNIKAMIFGEMFREAAAEKNLTLIEFGLIAEKDPNIDRVIDSSILNMARENKDIILESRLSAYMLQRNNIPAFKIYLDASPNLRIKRLSERDGETLDKACSNTIKRQNSEAYRYMTNYGIDINDKSVYDLIINTDNLTPDEIIKMILNAVGAHS